MLISYILLLEVLPTTLAQTVKFSSFFPLLSAATYEDTSNKICNVTLAQYHRSLRGSNTTDWAATCSRQQRCILANLTQDISARMSSASVFLGLTPGLLASADPSVSEISLLSMERPIVSCLISLGCRAVFPSRVLQYDNAQHVLYIPSLHFDFPRSTDQGLGWQRPLLLGKYLLLCGAIVNTFYTSWELGTRTVVSFRCISYLLPLVWTLLSLAIHIVAASAFQIQKVCHRVRHRSAIQDRATQDGDNLSDALPNPLSAGLNLQLEQRIKPTKAAVAVNYLATILGFAHVTFGMLIFSSLQFIEVIDVAAVILRYLVSTLVSRLILINELSDVRRHRNIVQRDHRDGGGPNVHTFVSIAPQLPSIPLPLAERDISRVSIEKAGMAIQEDFREDIMPVET